MMKGLLIMKKNIGRTDRIVRACAGVAAAVLAFLTAGTLRVILGIVAAAMLFTAASGFCSLYVPLGINTIKGASCHGEKG